MSNVAYILALLASIVAEQDEADETVDTASRTKAILDLLGSEPRLRSKRELIEEFIAAYLPTMKNAGQTRETFRDFWEQKRDEAFDTICAEEKLDRNGFSKLLETYQFSGKRPLTDEIIDVMAEVPGILHRKPSAERIITKMIDFIETYEDGMGNFDDQ